MAKISRDNVFVAGGQPSVTYVDREQADVERMFARAVASPNQIVALAGPTKCGKTVLCKHVLRERQFVLIDGGQVRSSEEVWDKVCAELQFPAEETFEEASETQVSGGVTMCITANGSQLSRTSKSRTFKVDNLSVAISYLIENDIALIIDDFHYLEDADRKNFLRNVKGAVFKGLKVILLCVTHRIFDATKAESELTGRFTSVSIPEWSREELLQIPTLGFAALKISCPDAVVDELAKECQSSPFLMQKFCWEICYDIGVDIPKSVSVPIDFDRKAVFLRLAKDSGLPIYQRLVAGPEIRKSRKKRPLARGGEADVYEAVLLAIAETGPASSISYESLRDKLNEVLTASVPQKHEVTAVLKQLAAISKSIGVDAGIDWDADERKLNISDPYLRFYLRWHVRQTD